MKATGRKIIISGGGTGGHIYPALTVGQKLLEKDTRLLITFIGSHRKIERKIMERYGVKFIPLKIEGIKGKGLKAFSSIFLLPFSFFKSLALLLRLRPDLVIGVGGYSSGPVVLLASLLRIPTIILEQNLRPGVTNRLLLRFAKKAVVSFENSLSHFKGKGVFLGNPVREEFYSLLPKKRDSRLAILIFGGSQGSHFLNIAMTSTLPFLKDKKEDLHILHQTGKADFEWVRASYFQSGFDDALVSPYFFDMADTFEKSDLIISRAGATTIAELIVAQKAALLIPFAAAADDHQTLNAKELERVGGAEVLPESEVTPQFLARKIRFYLENREKITLMEKNLAVLRVERPAEKIVDLCFSLMEARS